MDSGINRKGKHVLLADVRSVAQEVLEQISQRTSTTITNKAFLVALLGDLGAGKTTFMQALAKEFGIQGVVQSPTYVLMKSYPISFLRFTKLIHIDAYRLNAPEEFQTLKPEEFLYNPQNLVCIEWPERVAGELPAPDLRLNFSSEGVGDNSRYIEVV